jgi:hypothetical protein
MRDRIAGAVVDGVAVLDSHDRDDPAPSGGGGRRTGGTRHGWFQATESGRVFCTFRFWASAVPVDFQFTP